MKIKVNSAVLREAEEQLNVQFRSLDRIQEQLQTAKAALLNEDDTFYRQAQAIAGQVNEVGLMADRLRAIGNMAEQLAGMYARCEREQGSPRLSTASAGGELFRGAGAAGAYIEPGLLQAEYRILIDPLIGER